MAASHTSGANMTLLAAGTPTVPGFTDATVRSFTEKITFAEQEAGSTIKVARLPKGAVVLGGLLIASATAGATATLAIGITGATGKYRTAAVFTAADTPTLFGNAAACGAALTAEEEVFITTAVATLPAAGTLQVTFFYAFN